MLYTNHFGETRIRVFNMAFDVIANLHQYLKMAIVENYVQYFIKEKLCRVHEKGCKRIREEILNHTVDILFTYRKQCAHNSSPSQLVIPESLKLFPVYISTALKSHAMRLLNQITENQLDLKIYWIHKYMSMPFGRVTY